MTETNLEPILQVQNTGRDLESGAWLVAMASREECPSYTANTKLYVQSVYNISLQSTIIFRMEGDPDNLENIRRKLRPHLPASIQAYNSVVLAMSDDGIERRVVSTADHCSVAVLNREQPSGLMISMFSSSEADDDLRKLLEENINWTEEIDFVVSLIKELGTVLTDVHTVAYTAKRNLG